MAITPPPLKEIPPMDALTKKTRDLLNSVATSTDPAPGVKFLTTKTAAAALGAGYLQSNAKKADDKGNLAHRLTDNGKTFLASLAEEPATPPAGAASTAGAATKLTGSNGTFVSAAIDLPEPTNTRKSGYPTDALPAPTTGADGKVKYHGMFIPPKEGTDPAKAYPAIASAANKRWADKTPIRKFTSRVMDGGVFDPAYKGVIGVGIFRTE